MQNPFANAARKQVSNNFANMQAQPEGPADVQDGAQMQQGPDLDQTRWQAAKMKMQSPEERKGMLDTATGAVTDASKAGVMQGDALLAEQATGDQRFQASVPLMDLFKLQGA